jgi:prepilin-type N-terminal cleavage/methylation domain-containing protein
MVDIMHPPGFKSSNLSTSGFTLAELLIALAILGVIATFTIPKVLQSQQDTRNKAIAKEAAGTISAAFLAYKGKNPDFSMQTFWTTDLEPYLNYVSLTTDGSRSVDGTVTDATTLPCTTPMRCLRLHNGATMYYWPMTFCDTTDKVAIWFRVDPDSAANGKYVAINFYLYPNGRLYSDNGLESLTHWGWGWPTCQQSISPGDNPDPPWFNWN